MVVIYLERVLTSCVREPDADASAKVKYGTLLADVTNVQLGQSHVAVLKIRVLFGAQGSVFGDSGVGEFCLLLRFVVCNQSKRCLT